MKRERYIGTSGYSYGYWKGRFYPQGLPAGRQLAYYAEQFNSLELNYTFYRFPTLKALQKTAAILPEGFKCSVKAHKVITHTLRLKQAREKVTEFTDIVTEGLGERLGCILFQLPPSFSFSEERINDLLACVEHHSRTVVEFRHASWWTPEVYETFRAHRLTFCSVSFPGLPDDNIVTSDIFYRRMHGVPELFKSPYTNEALEQLADSVPDVSAAYIYFNNTMFEAGYTNANTLRGLMM